MYIEQLEPTQAEQDLKGMIKSIYGRYYGIDFVVAENYPSIYFILTDGDNEYYFRSNFNAVQFYTYAEIVSKCMEIANL